MRLKNTFIQGKLNKDIDERMIPNGQYPHAENIRVANSEGSDAGAIENTLGNEKVTNFNLTNAKTIGSFADGSNQKIYWFTTSDEKDLVVEYDVKNTQTNILLESSKPNSVLNFDKSFLITGVSKIINGEPNRDLLLWTDDLNQPRMINIERAKTYGADGFVDEDILLIKKPPRFAPSTNLTFTPSTLENNLEDRFLSFAYRYKYLDGEYSSLSSFSNYNFAPNRFELDYQTMENNGMVNSFNAIDITFNTGSERVTDIQLVVKESNSGSLAIVETFNKEKENWGNNIEESFLFANSKKYVFLSEDELFRAYDNVPLKAKAMEVIGNRVVFGNYVEGYNLVNKFGEKVRPDYNLSLLSKDLSGESLDVTLGTNTVSNDLLTFDLSGVELDEGIRLTFDIPLSSTGISGTFSDVFNIILSESYQDAQALAQSDEFTNFVGTVMMNVFLANYSATEPDDSELLSNTPFSIEASTANTISIKAPTLTYQIDNTPGDPNDSDFTNETYEWIFLSSSEVFFREISIDTSLKTERSYEVGIIYMDEYNRATTVLTDKGNTINVPQKFSINQNKIVVNINSTPPAFADRYKLVVKQNKGNYQTLYTNLFYEDGLFRWIKLDGANRDKVKEGDTLIVKSDLSGVVEEPVKVRVLEVVTKQPDFIEGNVFEDTGEDIIEEAGLYMKIKPVGFNINFEDGTVLNYDQYDDSNSSKPAVTMGRSKGTLAGFFDTTTNQYVDYEITGGSRIRLKFRNYESDGYNELYEKEFLVQGNYANFQEWWEAEVINLGDKEASFFWEFIRDTGDNALFLRIRGEESGATFERSKLSCKIDISLSEGIVIFETESEDEETNIYYETEQTFLIENGYHKGNLQDQSASNSSAIVEMDFFNCYTQGNGAESYRIKDTFNSRFLNIDLRPTTTSVEEYQQVRRYADLTYSATYNENTNLNGLNEFNLSLANFKEDIDKKYGFIQRLYARDTDLLIFQEDKVSRVLYGKDLLLNADGTSNISSIEDVLGQQIMYSGEYGISRNPESFDFHGDSIYFTDSKRGAVLRLANNGISEISKFGMSSWFRNLFKDQIDTKKIGSFDPYNNQYIIHPTRESFITTTSIDCSGLISKSNFDGETIVNIDFGIKTGNAGFNYSSNGVPVKYDIEWNGQNFTTGYVGDSSYNEELGELGLPNVSGSGTGTFTFNKDSSLPTSIKVTVTAPICDASFTIDGNCISNPDLKVVSVILNDDRDKDLTMLSRYKWSTGSYDSSFKNYSSIFDQNLLDTYDLQEGEEGTQFIPLSGGSIRIESFNGFSQTAEFLDGNRLGYLVSNTLYTDSQLENLVSFATFPAVNKITQSNGDIVNRVDFNFNRPNGEEYLYLIWDYRDEKPALPCGGSLSASGNDGVYILEAQLGSNTGTVEVEFDAFSIPDRFQILYDGQIVADSLFVGDALPNSTQESEITTVTSVDRFVYDGQNFIPDGQESVNFTSADIAVGDGTETRASGSGTNQIGVVPNLPSPSALASDGNVTLTFEKNTEFPTTMEIRVTGVNGGTAWDIIGLQCPI